MKIVYIQLPGKKSTYLSVDGKVVRETLENVSKILEALGCPIEYDKDNIVGFYVYNLNEKHYVRNGSSQREARSDAKKMLYDYVMKGVKSWEVK